MPALRMCTTQHVTTLPPGVSSSAQQSGIHSADAAAGRHAGSCCRNNGCPSASQPAHAAAGECVVFVCNLVVCTVASPACICATMSSVRGSYPSYSEYSLSSCRSFSCASIFLMARCAILFVCSLQAATQPVPHVDCCCSCGNHMCTYPGLFWRCGTCTTTIAAAIHMVQQDMMARVNQANSVTCAKRALTFSTQ